MALRSAVGLSLLLLSCGACHDPVLRVTDAVIRPDRPAHLVAYVERETLLGRQLYIPPTTVRFTAGVHDLGTAVTDRTGRAALDADLPPDSTAYEATATVWDHALYESAPVFDWRDGRVLISVDIDNTIARPSYKALAFKHEDWRSLPLPDAAEVLQELTRDYHVIYFTARPWFLEQATRHWLLRQGFPPGPLILAQGLRDAAGLTNYKGETLRELRARLPELMIGVGNSPRDVVALGENQMLAVILVRELEDAYGFSPVLLPNWREVRRFFAANRDVLSDPAALAEVIRGERLLLRAVIPYTAP
jgi:hypothetical protein